jgi:hypothetical protein
MLGTPAARIQSRMGNVRAGGLFARAQSTAAAGVSLLCKIISGIVTGLMFIIIVTVLIGFAGSPTLSIDPR